MTNAVDAVVIGGGFYGVVIACYLAQRRGLRKVMIIEREEKLLSRASYNNQARVHNGYHYPRSFTTANRSRVNSSRFISDWPAAVKKDFAHLYAIARRNSKVSSRQFQRFCQDIGAKLAPADLSHRQLFEPRLIEDVFLVEEFAFDAVQLLDWAGNELRKAGVEVVLNNTVTTIAKGSVQPLQIKTLSGGAEETYSSQYVFNCTYSGLNQFAGDFAGTKTALKHEVAELALIKASAVFENLGVTVMDGPFFSMMPFPARDLHTLSHVRYTPHLHWQDAAGLNPYDKLADYQGTTRVNRMLRDLSRYLPAILVGEYVESLMEIKTILAKNEGDDGRPILFQKHIELPGCYSVLGGKIDNVYDVIEKLDGEKIE